MQVRHVIIIASIITIIIVFFKSATGKGFWGELKIRFILGFNRKGKKYVFNNYKMILNGKSTQIDHIVVNKNGVFVIETKNYAGIIYGDEKDHKWLQVPAGGNVENEFYNPVKQNRTHIYQSSQIKQRSCQIANM